MKGWFVKMWHTVDGKATNCGAISSSQPERSKRKGHYQDSEKAVMAFGWWNTSNCSDPTGRLPKRKYPCPVFPPSSQLPPRPPVGSAWMEARRPESLADAVPKFSPQRLNRGKDQQWSGPTMLFSKMDNTEEGLEVGVGEAGWGGWGGLGGRVERCPLWESKEHVIQWDQQEVRQKLASHAQELQASLSELWTVLGISFSHGHSFRINFYHFAILIYAK